MATRLPPPHVTLNAPARVKGPSLALEPNLAKQRPELGAPPNRGEQGIALSSKQPPVLSPRVGSLQRGKGLGGVAEAEVGKGPSRFGIPGLRRRRIPLLKQPPRGGGVTCLREERAFVPGPRGHGSNEPERLRGAVVM